MEAGYVKTLIWGEALSESLYLSVDGQTRRFTREDVMERRKESWFGRAVALSPRSNAIVVRKSVERLHRRRQTGIAHQIIAVACSIRHAQELVQLYEQYGVRATCVHSNLLYEERLARLEAFEAGDYDVVTQVGLLGEGYDNQKISIAAIFRPFKSLSAFAQFIGRALRRIDGGQSGDQIGEVITHAGLNLTGLWHRYRDEDWESAVQETEWKDNELDPRDPMDDDNQESAVREMGPVVDVLDDVVSAFAVSGFLTDTAPRVIEEDIVVTPNTPPSVLPTQESPSKLPAVEPPVAPPNEQRQQQRNELSKEIRRRAGRVMRAVGLGNDRARVDALGYPEASTHYECVIRILNRIVNRRVGVPESQSKRWDWSDAEIQVARAGLNESEQEAITTIGALLRVQEGS